MAHSNYDEIVVSDRGGNSDFLAGMIASGAQQKGLPLCGVDDAEEEPRIGQNGQGGGNGERAGGLDAQQVRRHA